MISDGHLWLNQLELRESSEWTPALPGWHFVRVVQGIGYWLAGGAVQNFGPGELVVCRSGSGVVRASQLGPIQLQVFRVCPEMLTGLLSLQEVHRLNDLAAQNNCFYRLFPSSAPLASQLAAFCSAGDEPENGVVRRCQRLEAAMSFFAELLGPPVAAPSLETTVNQRFQKLVSSLPDAELLQRSPAELAGDCGCSVRHFNRLFQGRFGKSVRERKRELRLQKARQLLADTQSKIITVALDSGFRHLGLFNALFKKEFGMTPSEWRQENVKKMRNKKLKGGVLALLLLVGLLPAVLFAQEPPVKPPAPATNAAPVPNAPVQVKIYASKYIVEGNTILPQEVIDQTLAGHIGKLLSSAEIEATMGALQMAYRDRGYATVKVGFPPQTVTTNGIVHLEVVQGRLVQVDVVDGRYFSSNNVMRSFPSLRSNVFLNSLVFNQELDRANANRDRQIYPQIAPGPEPGTSQLILKVKDHLPLHGRLEINNQNTPGTPPLRVNAAVQYNNLWQLDHQMGVTYSFTPIDFKDLDRPEMFFNKPLIASYSFFYRVPLDTGGLPGAPPIYSVSDFGYDEATKRFRAPPLSGRNELMFFGSRSDSSTGVTTVINNHALSSTSEFTDKTEQENFTINTDMGGRFMHPMPDFFGIHSTLSFGVDFKEYHVRHYETNSISDIPIPPPPPAVAPPPTLISNTVGLQPAPTRLDYMPFTFGWDASRPDKYGSTSFSWNNSFHFASLLNSANDFKLASYTPKSDGNYFIANLSLTRDQKIYHDWTLRLRADGQWANEPLFSNEQFGLGGVNGLRGYREGQEYGDTGWRVIVEPRTPAIYIGELDGTMASYARLSYFLDFGKRYLLEPAPGRLQSLRMMSTGVALSVTMGDRIEGRAFWGVQLFNTPGIEAGKGTLGFSVAVQF